MKYLVIIILSLMVNCLPQPFSKNTAKADNIQLLYVYCFAMYTAWTEVTTVTDNKDGTVRVFVEGVNPCGGRKYVSDTLLKKCIQGQVFRPAQNDCKGTGTSTDYYGAQKFQWCPTNDDACDTGSGSLNIIVSPVGKTCSSDNLINKKWSVISYLSSQVVRSFINSNQEFPKEEYLWYNVYKFSLGYSEAPIVKLSQFENVQLNLKNSYNYVLCGI